MSFHTTRPFYAAVLQGYGRVLASTSDVIEKLDALVWLNTNVLERFPEEVRIQQAWLRVSPPDASRHHTTKIRERTRRVTALLNEGIEAGELRPAGTSTSAFIECMHNLVAVPAAAVDAASPDRSLAAFRETVLVGIAPWQGSGPAFAIFLQLRRQNDGNAGRSPSCAPNNAHQTTVAPPIDSCGNLRPTQVRASSCMSPRQTLRHQRLEAPPRRLFEEQRDAPSVSSARRFPKPDQPEGRDARWHGPAVDIRSGQTAHGAVLVHRPCRERCPDGGQRRQGVMPLTGRL